MSRMGASLGIIKLKNVLGLDEDEKQWNSLYTLRISMLPQFGFITSSMAEKILFIGKAVRVLQSKKTNEQDRISMSDL